MPTRNTSIEINWPASTGGEWTVTVTANMISCTCPAWRYQDNPTTDRDCKHTRRVTRHAVDHAVEQLQAV